MKLKTLKLNEQGLFELLEAKEMKTKKCEKDDFPLKDEKYFKKQGVFMYYCMDDWNVILQGYWSESYLSYLSLELFQCDYDLTPEKGASKFEIEEFTRNNLINFRVIPLEYQVSVTDFSNPKTAIFSNPIQISSIYIRASEM